MGTLIVTNFPTPCSMTSMPTIRDQFSMLESISTFMGIVHVKIDEGARPGTGDYCSYGAFESQIKNVTLVQFGAEKITECNVDAGALQEGAKAVAAEFFSFQEKAEQAR